MSARKARNSGKKKVPGPEPKGPTRESDRPRTERREGDQQRAVPRGAAGSARGSRTEARSPASARRPRPKTRPAVSARAVWIFGRNVVAEAIASGRTIEQIWIADGAEQLGPLEKLAEKAGVRVSTTGRANLDAWAGTDRHQGVFAAVAEYRFDELDPLLDELEARPEPPFLLLLNEVQDPHNLGSIMRTADAAGVDAIVLPFRRSVGLTAGVAKSSAGAIEYVRVVEASNLNRLAEKLKERGYWIAGAEADGAVDYREPDYAVPLALVIGGEDKGLGHALRKKCDWVVKLPMQGRLNSLNASVAAALLMYQVVHSRS